MNLRRLLTALCAAAVVALATACGPTSTAHPRSTTPMTDEQLAIAKSSVDEIFRTWPASDLLALCKEIGAKTDSELAEGLADDETDGYYAAELTRNRCKPLLDN